MKKISLITGLLVVTTGAYAQFADMSKSFEEKKKTMSQKFDTFVEQTQEDFDAFRKQQNERYAEFMRNNWERLDMLPPILPEEEEKLSIEGCTPLIFSLMSENALGQLFT